MNLPAFTPGTRDDWQLAKLRPAQIDAIIAALGPEEAVQFEMVEQFSDAWERPGQVPRADSARRVLVIVGGRGCGKNWGAARWVIKKAKANPGCRIGIGSRTAADVRDVTVLGPSGILSQSPPWFFPKYVPSRRALEWPNGSVATMFASVEPAQLRGPQHHFVHLDEFGFFGRYGTEFLANAEQGLRLIPHVGPPQMLLTSSPANSDVYLDYVKGLRDKDGKRVPRPDVEIVRFSTLDNRANLAEDHLRAMSLLIHTARGRAEVLGLDIDAAPDALWDAELIAACRRADGFVLSPEALVTAFDPSHSADGGGDEAGIVTACRMADGTAIVLADDSMRGTPVQCWLQVFTTCEEQGSDEIVVEGKLIAQCRPELRQGHAKSRAEGAGTTEKREGGLGSLLDVEISKGDSDRRRLPGPARAAPRRGRPGGPRGRDVELVPVRQEGVAEPSRRPGARSFAAPSGREAEPAGAFAVSARKPRKRLAGKEPSIDVMVEILVHGKVEQVTAARAARLIAGNAAAPHDWTLEDLNAVSAADIARRAAENGRLVADGLLDGYGPGPNTPPRMSWAEAVSSIRRRLW